MICITNMISLNFFREKYFYYEKNVFTFVAMVNVLIIMLTSMYMSDFNYYVQWVSILWQFLLYKHALDIESLCLCDIYLRIKYMECVLEIIVDGCLWKTDVSFTW
jgi:hypothetical protein